ncbi:tRNA dihydrouridine(20/20a) synthase DusA [Pseudoxanthomonas winnipegensis]|uniref:tRNA dihydrouridine(20/20a) synthase DusA n=1 Tax=Pseudoxanthomonas winnipegensis TaxID=2480810 RepID=UPI001040272A|nr:tRNA dihydrouridine(20/20a) synthase DusA [Pseudoxanthomonas winnipegensis]TBV74410.1 tRNA dihydrouridine(20/20a) synthase DusA [Pseudoxanthomonas winnipegensis]
MSDEALKNQKPRDPRLSVAPMMDWTDRHCRAFHRVLAPGALLYTEMVHANAVLQGDRERLLGYDASEHPVALQLGGSEPERLAAAARIGQDYGYDEVNLNVGCPSDRVQAGRFGACLMKEPALVAECIAAMRAAVSIPVTVKCRLGVDELEDYAHFAGFIDTVAATGCDTFIVHARKAWLDGLSPKENREIPPLRYEWAYRLKRERPQLTISLNGGIADLEAIATHLTQVDAVMLGRAAYHDPYLLYRADAQLAGTQVRPREELLRALRPYVEAALARGVALKHITRHVLGLYAGQPGGRQFRQILSEGAHRPGADWSLVERALAATGAPLTAAA